VKRPMMLVMTFRAVGKASRLQRDSLLCASLPLVLVLVLTQLHRANPFPGRNDTAVAAAVGGPVGGKSRRRLDADLDGIPSANCDGTAATEREAVIDRRFGDELLMTIERVMHLADVWPVSRGSRRNRVKTLLRPSSICQ
jgi:hypothetical protein